MSKYCHAYYYHKYALNYFPRSNRNHVSKYWAAWTWNILIFQSSLFFITKKSLKSPFWMTWQNMLNHKIQTPISNQVCEYVRQKFRCCKMRTPHKKEVLFSYNIRVYRKVYCTINYDHKISWNICLWEQLLIEYVHIAVI